MEEIVAIFEFGFCAKFSSRENNIHCEWNFAKFSSRESVIQYNLVFINWCVPFCHVMQIRIENIPRWQIISHNIILLYFSLNRSVCMSLFVVSSQHYLLDRLGRYLKLFVSSDCHSFLSRVRTSVRPSTFS